MSNVPSQRTVTGARVPTSLTQPGNGSKASCPSCGSSRVTALAMTLTDGTPVSFASCHDCEHRHWAHEGRRLEIRDVLARATKVRA
jgi:transcription elongation factor Elf1